MEGFLNLIYGYFGDGNLPLQNDCDQGFWIHQKKRWTITTPAPKVQQRGITHRIHVWYIYLHLVDSYVKSRYIYHVSGDRQGCTPGPTYPVMGNPYISPIYSGNFWVIIYNPQESPENTMNTMGTLLGVHPIVP